MSTAEAQDVVVAAQGRVGRITLNRPKALHALTEQMCVEITRALLEWRDDPTIELVLIDHAGERGFCAGGDIRMLAQSGLGDGVEARSFFATEYRLNHLLFTYPKPTVAVMDGLVMGGGAGIALPCRHRIATQRTVFAMPETGIGLVPDVGGGWHLSRLPGRTGLWLGLTGARLKWADCLSLGVADTAVAIEDLDRLKDAIVDAPSDVEALIFAVAVAPGLAPLDNHRPALEWGFQQASVEAVLKTLSDGDAWSRAQAEILKTKSPHALKITFRQLRDSADHRNFASTLAMEYRLATRLVRHHDFQEGVRAVIVDKDNTPVWSPRDLAQVSNDAVDEFFAPLPADQEWTPLGAGDRQ